jgi:hypothetical protein
MKHFRLILVAGPILVGWVIARVIFLPETAPHWIAPRADAAPLAAPVVVIHPISQTVSAGQVFTLSVSITDALDVGAYEFTLSYNAAVISPTAVTLGALQSTVVPTRTIGVPPFAPLVGGGHVTYAAYSYGPPPGASGSGTLAVLTFQAIANGHSDLHFLNDSNLPLEVVDSSGNLLSATSQDGSVDVGTLYDVYLPLIRR